MLKALARLWPYIIRTRPSLVAGLAAVLAATVLSLVSPWLLKYIVDGLVEGASRTQLGGLALVTVALAVGDGWFRYRMRQRIIGASRQIEYDLRQDFFAHLERLPPAYFQANRTGDLMSRATSDLGAVRMMVGPALMYFVSTALGFAIALGVMLWIDVRLTIVALLPLPGVTIGTRYFGQAIHDRFERIQAQLSEMSAVVQEALAGVRVVRAYRREAAEEAKFGRSNDEYVARNRGLIFLQAAFYPTLTLCFGLSALLVLWFGGRDVMTGRLTLGEFVAFSRYLVLLGWPLIAFGWVINLVQRGVASWERMLEVFDAPADPATALPAALEVRAPVEGAIEARHLTFRYPGAPAPALDDVSFTLEAGRTLALVGPTGCGKSTLVQLLPRLREPQRGTLFIDGIDVCDLHPARLRAAMAVVPQEPFLFSESVGGNILFGTGDDWGSEASRRRAAEAARLSALDTDIATFARAYDTTVGERGITLSGGQKQRVALARALATDPRILILDDALSAVDTATEEAVLRGLARVREARTCVLVSHRVSTVRDADLILVFEAGRVVERGTHDHLVASGGRYAAMHQRQLLEDEVSRVTAVAHLDEEPAPATGYDRRMMGRLVRYVVPHRGAVAIACAAMLAASGVELLQPWFTQQAIDRFIATGDTSGLTRMATLFLGLLLVGFGAEYVQTAILQLTGQRIMHRLRTEVYAHLQRLDLAYFDRNPVGRLMTRVTTDVDALNELFATGVITVFGDLVVLLGITAAMIVLDWRLALVAFSVLPFIAWVAHWFRTRVREFYRQVRGLVARLNAFLQEHLTGMATVQMFNQERRTLDRFEAINRRHRDVNVQAIRYYAVFYPLIEILAAVSGALIIWVGLGRALEGTVSLGVLVAFLQYSRRFFQPISDLSEKFNILQAAMAASERIFGVLDTTAAIVPPASGYRPRSGAARGRIEFDRVWFAYTADEFVLRDVSFVVEPGQRVGIVGATGSGKTTIINLLLRFYDVRRGRILVDGVDVREWDLEALRAVFGLVLQDVHLFSGSIADNIRLGDHQITDAGIAAAATTVHADSFIAARPEGYESEVAERGASLSVGQKQLLSFARALAVQPTVLLLDEATSSIDTATELLIEEALHVMMANRTVVAIAHRLSTIQDMDRILVLSKGELRESGTHQELVAARGLYYRLYLLQYRIATVETGPDPAAVFGRT